jgi:hypothetical protein
LLKYGCAEDLQDFTEFAFNPEFLLDDCDEYVDTDRNPDLGLHGILRCAVESLDVQVLFDPFEEELDLPAASVKLSDNQRWQVEVVGQKKQSPSTIDVMIADIAQAIRICSQ